MVRSELDPVSDRVLLAVLHDVLHSQRCFSLFDLALSHILQKQGITRVNISKGVQPLGWIDV